MQPEQPSRPTQEECEAIDVRVGTEAIYRDRPLLARVRVNGVLVTQTGISIGLVLVRDLIGGEDGPEPRSTWEVYASWEVFRSSASTWSCPPAGWYLSFDQGLVRALDEFCARHAGEGELHRRYERALEFMAGYRSTGSGG